MHFKNLNYKPYGETVKEWYEKQEVALSKFVEEKKGALFSDLKVEARLVYDGKRHKLGKAKIVADKEKLFVSLKKREDMVVDFSTLYGVTVVGKRKINFYLPLF